MFIRRVALSLGGALFALNAFAGAVNPFTDHNGALPAASEYNGPLFKLSYRYPTSLAAQRMPWRTAIGGARINTKNAAAYTAALKDFVGPDMQQLLTDYANWNPEKLGWYNDPWLGGQREAIRGLLVGLASVDASLFPRSGLEKPFTTYVVTYYNRTAGLTLGRIWGTTAMNPVVDQQSTQYADGSVTVKLAFTTAGPDEWPAMEGALALPAMVTTNATTGQFDKPTLHKLHLMQVDIVVKDSRAAPETGWVFTTLVYDKDAVAGRLGIWDKMVPLGAQWGNDPQVGGESDAPAQLQETWVNPAAPLYAKETLGWGGRLSGPNDHAVNNISVVENGTRRMVRGARNSSCLSCHGTSQWNVKNPSVGMASFLMPLSAASNGAGSPHMNSPQPGSKDWMRWFQNRAGDVPMDPGSVAGDYDLALTFRVLPAWLEATTGKLHMLRSMDAGGKKVERDYAGKPRD